MAALEDYDSEDLINVADLTTGQLEQVAVHLRYGSEGTAIHDLPDKDRLALALEALVRAKDDLTTAVDAAAQLRKEFEAFKGEVRTGYLPRR